MIASNIDGTVGGSNQLFDLISLVSDPQAYAEKVKRLEDAAAESKKYVELVAPASDILTLREESQADRAEAARELKEAKTEAASIRAKAKALTGEAQAEAEKIVEEAKVEAQAIRNQAAAEKQELASAIKEAKKDSAEAKRAVTGYKKLADEAKAQTAEAEAAIKSSEALKADIIARHKAFIESL